MPVQLMLYVTPNSLPTGNYYRAGLLMTAGPVDAGSALSVTVFLTVNGSAGGGGINYNETIAVSPLNLAFTFQPGSAVPAAQTLSVTTSDNAGVITAVTTNDGNPWLAVNPATSVDTRNPECYGEPCNPVGRHLCRHDYDHGPECGDTGAGLAHGGQRGAEPHPVEPSPLMSRRIMAFRLINRFRSAPRRRRQFRSPRAAMLRAGCRWITIMRPRRRR